jgi:DNA-binding response OmpR family regulator
MEATMASTRAITGTDAPDTDPDLSVLVYSSNATTRETVRKAIGPRPAEDLPAVGWVECATAEAVLEAIETIELDVLILDGEAAPAGGLGLSRQIKDEYDGCPPVLVLTGRPQDAWLGTWSLAEAVVSRPLDPLILADTVADLIRGGTE